MGPQGKGTAEAPGGTDPAGTGSSVEASVAAAESGRGQGRRWKHERCEQSL